MIIETIFGIVLTIVGGGDAKADPATMVLKGIYQGSKILKKEEKQGDKKNDDQ